MKKRNTLIAAVLTVALLLNLSACSGSDTGSTSDSWSDIKFVPFSGYVCACDEENIFLQFPFVLPIGEAVSLSDIKKAMLVCDDDTEMFCSDYSLSSAKTDEEKQYQLMTFTIQAKAPHKGEYSVNHLKVLLTSGAAVNLDLNNIRFSVDDKPDGIDDIEMTRMMITQPDYDRMKISYKNKSEKAVEITGISYDNNRYSGVDKIEKYDDFDLSQRNKTDLIIHPGEEKTFLFQMTPKPCEFDQYENKFFFALPFLYYKIDGVEKFIPAQTQATIIQPNMTSDFLAGLLM